MLVFCQKHRGGLVKVTQLFSLPLADQCLMLTIPDLM